MQNKRIRKVAIILLFSGIILCPTLKSQEPDDQFNSIAFKGTRLVNNQSTETNEKRTLNLMINHRFGLINSGIYDFFGLDEAEIRLALDYGITDYLSVGIGRSSYQKTYDLVVKGKILRQKKKGIPLTLSGFAGSYYNTLRDIYPEDYDNFGNRLSYVFQLLAARKFSERISILAEGGVLFENYNVFTSSPHSTSFYGIGGKIMIFDFLNITGEFIYINNKLDNTYDPLSLGIEIDTGGHLFQLIFSNTQATFEKALLSDTRYTWSEGDIFFGFNLIRVFDLN